MITTSHFKTLDDLYDFYNKILFADELPECILNMSRGSSANTAGYFSKRRWIDEEKKYVHEISLTPFGLSWPAKEWHATLVHEMCHLWQHEFGKPSRPGYHNHDWAAKMEAIGLMPSSTGKPGGKKVGQRMADYPIEGGLFEETFNSLDESDLESFRLKYLPIETTTQITVDTLEGEDTTGEGEGESTEGKPKSGKRIKYTCSCGTNIWGKGDLSIKCNECNCDFIEQ